MINTYTIKPEYGHFIITLYGKFIASTDTISEANKEIEQHEQEQNKKLIA